MMKEKTRTRTDGFIRRIVVTSTTVPMHLFKGDYSGYITTLKAHKGNTGDLYIQMGEAGDIFTLDANEAQVTRFDLDKLLFYSDAGTEILVVWAERDIQKVAVG